MGKNRNRIKNHQFFLKGSFKEALKGIRKGEGGPFGAVLVRNNKIISTGHNTVLKSKDPTCHAEINTLKGALKKIKGPFLKNCVLYSSTEPCPMCFSALHWARIKKIVYSTPLQEVKRLGFNELQLSIRSLKKRGKSPVQIQQLELKEAHDLLQTWRRSPKKRTY